MQCKIFMKLIRVGRSLSSGQIRKTGGFGGGGVSFFSIPGAMLPHGLHVHDGQDREPKVEQ